MRRAPSVAPARSATPHRSARRPPAAVPRPQVYSQKDAFQTIITDTYPGSDPVSLASKDALVVEGNNILQNAERLGAAAKKRSEPEALAAYAQLSLSYDRFLKAGDVRRRGRLDPTTPGRSLPANCLQFARKLLAVCPQIACSLPANCLQFARKLPANCLRSAAAIAYNLWLARRQSDGAIARPPVLLACLPCLLAHAVPRGTC